MAPTLRSTLALAAICAAVAVAAESVKKPNNLVVGSRAPGDHLLQREFVKVPSKWLWGVAKAQRTFAGDHHSHITQLRLLDQNAKGNGATAHVVAGGVGHTFFTAKFESQRGHSVDYIVEVYGR